MRNASPETQQHVDVEGRRVQGRVQGSGEWTAWGSRRFLGVTGRMSFLSGHFSLWVPLSCSLLTRTAPLCSPGGPSLSSGQENPQAKPRR